MTRHLQENELAGLIDGSLEHGDRQRATQHVRVCEQCRAILRDAARWEHEWRTHPEDFAATEDLAALGRKVQPPGRSLKEGSGPEKGWRGWIRNQRPWQVAPLAAAVVAVIVCGWIYLGPPLIRSRAGLDPALISPVQQVVLEAANRGSFILPGVETRLDESSPVRNSGYVPRTPELNAALLKLAEAYRQGPAPEQAAQWLVAGQIATGQISAARDVLADMAATGVDSPQLQILAAIVSFSEGDADQAEQLLRRVIEHQPTDATARVNLALVLAQTGRTTEAVSLLEAVVAERPDSRVARRASSILVGIARTGE